MALRGQRPVLPPPPAVAADLPADLDGDRPSRPAIDRSDSSRARPSAISSRSATGRYRPPAGRGPFDFTPPACPNHANAFTGPTPAAAPAS